MHSQPSPSFITARASRPIWRPVSSHSVLLNDCASVIGNANLVVLHAPQCAQATPEVASVYQLYQFIPRLGVAGQTVPSAPIFSVRVMWLSASAMRSSSGAVASQYLAFEKLEPFSVHGLLRSCRPWKQGESGGLAAEASSSDFMTMLGVKVEQS